MVVPLKIREKVFGVLTTMGSVNNGRAFSEKDLYYLSFLTQNAANAIENMALYENIYENLFATLYAFVNALEARDPYTQQHSNRVAGISLIIGEQLDRSPEELETLSYAGYLHDIGKIGIRDDILLKPGSLTKEEFRKLQEHPIIGARIVERLGLWEAEKQIIRGHHERFDGSGYPDGLHGEEIPLLARIMSVADVFDAMASNRAYRKKMETDTVLRIIEEGSGSQFDPQVVDAFLQLCREGTILPESDYPLALPEKQREVH
jgi:putative nucleotidyltransferase with HDIG domain